jgi:hypothetical protein
VADERQMDKFVEKRWAALAIRDADWAAARPAAGAPSGWPSSWSTAPSPTAGPGAALAGAGAVAWSDPILDALEAVRRDPSVARWCCG